MLVRETQYQLTLVVVQEHHQFSILLLQRQLEELPH
jgi:hypothetical protein